MLFYNDYKKKRVLKEKLKRIFSRFIRLRDLCICFTCGVHLPIEEMDAGHLEHGVLDFDENNLHCQCRKCNQARGGDREIYIANFVSMYGEEAYEDLRARAMMEKGKGIKYEMKELNDLFQKYKKKVKELE